MEKRITLSISLSTILILILSCRFDHSKKEPEFVPSKIYPNISCLADSNTTYALMLPSEYNKDKPYPVLILFDPHGDGLLPVNVFSSEAAKNGFIIAGSNNSKNGMSAEQTNSIYRNIITDLTSRFNIEKKAVYLGGFSGGSRVAGAAAIIEGGVAGVVGCGAGMPNINQKPANKFSYLALVGNQDFNYAEMHQLDKSLEQAGYQHYLLVFNGIHQWPPNEVIPDIFSWLRFDAMRNKALVLDRNEINRFIELNDKNANTLASERKPAQQQEIYIKMIHYLNGLTEVSPLQAEIERLGKNKNVIESRIKEEQILQTERELQQKLAPQLQRQSIEWWSAETTSLWMLAEKPDKNGLQAVYRRVLGYLSLSCYMLSTGALKERDLVSAAKYIEIYRLVDPTNAEHRYLASKVAAINHQADEALTELEQAFNLGFKDLNRLKSDQDFTFLLNEERFRKFSDVK